MKRASNYSPENLERYIIVLVSLFCAGLLVYLGIKGPLIIGDIAYKTHDTVYNQLIAQDAVNTFVIAPILIIGALALAARKRYAKYLLVLTPLFLIYYAISYGIGWEWMASDYQGNSEHYFFHFLGVLIAALLILLYSFTAFKSKRKPQFNRKALVIYSIGLVLFLSLFALMWMKEIFELYANGTTRGYELAPTAFWLVRLFDLGFSIPLGFISLYLLWLRPGSSFPLQMLIYGFFLSMSVVVNAMALVMYLNGDPTFDLYGSVIFIVLMAIVFFGYGFILRGYKR